MYVVYYFNFHANWDYLFSDYVAVVLTLLLTQPYWLCVFFHVQEKVETMVIILLFDWHYVYRYVKRYVSLVGKQIKILMQISYIILVNDSHDFIYNL